MAKIVVVSEGLPHPLFGGVGSITDTIIKELQRRGHTVALAVITFEEIASHAELKEIIKNLEDRGVEVIIAPYVFPKLTMLQLLKQIWLRMERAFPGFQTRQKVTDFVAAQDPEILFLFGWDAIASQHSVTTVPKFGMVVDPAHLPLKYRMKFNKRYGDLKIRFIHYVKSLLAGGTRAKLMRRHMADMLNSCQASGALAAHHAAGYVRDGAVQCRYYRAPIPEPARDVATPEKSTHFKITMIGSLQGTATLHGIELFAKEINPILQRELPPDSYEINIIGWGFQMLPNEIKALLNGREIKNRGFVENITDEFYSSHILLVPIPIDLGMRVRILTALSYGTCVVAHEANRYGIPELISGKNCLLGSNAQSIAEHCISVFRHPEKRQAIESAARNTYSRLFSPQVAASEICEDLERLLRVSDQQFRSNAI